MESKQEDKLKFDSNGLITAVAQDKSTNEVLMVAWMDKTALELTKETGFAHYYSRSRKELWKKGETSGHFQRVVKIMVDCDNDTLLLFVEQTGSACHTFNKSCFYRELKEIEEK